MTLAIRRLGVLDTPVLALIAAADEDFDVDERGAPRVPLDMAAEAPPTYLTRSYGPEAGG